MPLQTRLGRRLWPIADAKQKTGSPYPEELSAAMSKDELLQAYRNDASLIRRFEEKAGQLYGMGFVGRLSAAPLHRAGSRGRRRHAAFAKRKATKSSTSYRDHGHMLATSA